MKALNKEQVAKKLKYMEACPEARRWFGRQKTLASAWKNLKDVDYFMWLIASMPKEFQEQVSQGLRSLVVAQAEIKLRAFPKELEELIGGHPLSRFSTQDLCGRLRAQLPPEQQDQITDCVENINTALYDISQQYNDDLTLSHIAAIDDSLSSDKVIEYLKTKIPLKVVLIAFTAIHVDQPED